VNPEECASDNAIVLLPDPRLLVPLEPPEDVVARRAAGGLGKETLLVGRDKRRDSRRVGVGEGADVQVSAFS
jgi:hypothetical protein